MEIVMDETGRFWRCNDEGVPVAGPYDAEEDAERSAPADEDDE